MMVDGQYLDYKSKTQEAMFNNEIKLFPSLASEKVNLHFDDPFTGRIKVHKVEGQLMEKLDCQASRMVQIDCSTFQFGMYIVQCRNQLTKNVTTLKFIKQ